MKENEKFIYLAGIIDGEGTIYFIKDYSKTYQKNTKRGFGWRGGLTVSNTNKKLFEWIKNNFPNIGSFNWYLDKRIGIKRKGRWSLRANDTRKLLPKVFPFLIIKKKQAELTLKGLNLLKEHTSRWNIIHDEELEKICLKMKKLNKKAKNYGGFDGRI